MEVGKRIIKLRERRKWSQKDLAVKVNLNVSVMNRIESGERPIKDRELDKIATVLEVTTDYLLGRSSDPRLTKEQETWVDEETEEIFKVIQNMPEEKKKQAIEKILAYTKGLADRE